MNQHQENANQTWGARRSFSPLAGASPRREEEARAAQTDDDAHPRVEPVPHVVHPKAAEALDERAAQRLAGDVGEGDEDGEPALDRAALAPGPVVAQRRDADGRDEDRRAQVAGELLRGLRRAPDVRDVADVGDDGDLRRGERRVDLRRGREPRHRKLRML